VIPQHLLLDAHQFRPDCPDLRDQLCCFAFRRRL
jgi:hypothetical protein